MILLQQPPALTSGLTSHPGNAELQARAEKGDPKSAYQLARKLRESPENGVWIHLAASKGYAPARAALAVYFADRSPLGNDSQARKDLLAQARRDLPGILQVLIDGAKRGDVECMTSIGETARMTSRVSPKLLGKSEADDLRLFWLRKAVRTGQEDSIYKGEIQFEFAGLLRLSDRPENRKEGFDLLLRFAKAKHLSSILELIQIYKHGDERLGVLPNKTKAAHWASIAEQIEPESTIDSD